LKKKNSKIIPFNISFSSKIQIFILSNNLFFNFKKLSSQTILFFNILSNIPFIQKKKLPKRGNKNLKNLHNIQASNEGF